MTEIFADNIAQFRDINVVWFKRDLRIRDNKVLCDASARGQILPLYILEPDLWLQKDMSYRHFKFLEDAIDSLKRDLQSKNLDLVIKVGNAVDVFSYLKKKYKKPSRKYYRSKESKKFSIKVSEKLYGKYNLENLQFKSLINSKLLDKGEKYSDLPTIFMQHILEEKYNTTLDNLFIERVSKPLNLQSTFYIGY